MNEEILPIVDTDGNVTGKAGRNQCHTDKSLLHPVVHIHIYNKEKHLFLQKRPEKKAVQPGKWDTAVGGHVEYGETIKQAMHRELLEEIGLDNRDLSLFRHKPYIWESDIECEFVYVFTAQFDGVIRINTEELSDGRFWRFGEIRQNIGKGVFTPNLEYEFSLLQKDRTTIFALGESE